MLRSCSGEPVGLSDRNNRWEKPAGPLNSELCQARIAYVVRTQARVCEFVTEGAAVAIGVIRREAAVRTGHFGAQL